MLHNKINEDVFRVLCIDGGGMKGFYSALLLSVFEKHYSIKVSDCFDLICGTSTGGILTLGLSLGLPAHEVASFYKEKGQDIFPKLSKGKQIFRALKGPLYSGAVLRKNLEDILGDNKIKDAKTQICIPAINIQTNKPIVFKKDHNKKLSRDNDLLMVDVALATAAAPVYFQSHEISKISDQLIDGGLCYNNPSLIGLTESLEYFLENDKKNQCAILSIGNISSNLVMRKHKVGSIWNWMQPPKFPLLELTLNSQSNATHEVMKILQRSKTVPLTKYERIQEENYTEKDISLDSANSKAISKMEYLAYNKGNTIKNSEQISFFFKGEDNGKYK